MSFPCLDIRTTMQAPGRDRRASIVHAVLVDLSGIDAEIRNRSSHPEFRIGPDRIASVLPLTSVAASRSMRHAATSESLSPEAAG